MSDNVIPIMEHPLGKFWDQPKISDIEIDDTHALMDNDVFNQLYDYRGTIPTGAYEGKMWRCGNYLRWFGGHVEPDKVSINQREIILVDG